MSYVAAQNYWQGAETYVIVTAGGGHPGVNLDERPLDGAEVRQR